ncbi:3-hydroxyacyl-CoA dehydrogenase NAD-binding domain-containing protein [Amycolatopsis sp. NPDC005003]
MGVVGAGQMGRVIAEVFARADYDVLVDAVPDVLDATPDQIRASVDRAVRQGPLDSTAAPTRPPSARRGRAVRPHARRRSRGRRRDDQTVVLCAVDTTVRDQGAIFATNTSIRRQSHHLVRCVQRCGCCAEASISIRRPTYSPVLAELSVLSSSSSCPWTRSAS